MSAVSDFNLSWRDAWRPSSYWVLYGLSLRVSCRPARLAAVVGFFCIPLVITLLIRWLRPDANPESIRSYEVNFIYYGIAAALAPLVALLFASGMVQDEIEQQTLTYLLVRPLARPLVYLTKLAATVTIAYALAAAFTILGFTAIHLGNPQGDWPGVLTQRALPTAALFGLTIPVYVSIFGLIGMMTRWTLVVGAAYLIVIEFLLSSFEFVIRQFTVLYHFRALGERWMDLKIAVWAINLDDAPAAWTSVLCLSAVGATAALAGAMMMRAREFRVKTTEGG